MRGRTARVAIALAAVVGLAFTVPTGGSAQAFGFESEIVKVRADDGVELEALVLEPWGRGPHPLAVFASPWTMDWTQNVLPAVTLANKGYTVVSYVTRGFMNSGGEVGVAGPRDVRDFSEVIDWGLANTDSDPARIGAYGLSYGAGISLIAAAKDSRIKAVAALSGWYDLPASFARDKVRSLSAGKLLHSTGKEKGRLSAESDLRLSQVFQPDLPDADYQALHEWALARSPKTYLDGLNANKPAILIEQAWGETAFPPGPMLDFYNAYQGPKRVEFRPGDHAGPEIPALMGLPNGVLDPVYRWFDAFVGGADTSIVGEPNLRYKPRPVGRPFEKYSSSADAFGTPRRLHLTEDALAVPADVPTWARTIATDVDSSVSGGEAMLTQTLNTLLLEPSPFPVGAINREVAGVWTGEQAKTRTKIRGASKLHLPYTPSTAQGTLIAYILDVDVFNNARLVGYAPHTWAGATAGQPRTADFTFQPTAYDVEPGRRLAVVVDGKDTLFVDANKPGSAVTLGNTSAQPWIDIPIR
ncbi:CocE/NonD family hydrolase [Actinokineospora sp. G85]|uniref:alpha/beta hydrolase family protein n=1 Tax=Actinokineospora sp. G85 TaxID=3406626 RepID=UPI003C752628